MPTKPSLTPSCAPTLVARSSAAAVLPGQASRAACGPACGPCRSAPTLARRGSRLAILAVSLALAACGSGGGDSAPAGNGATAAGGEASTGGGTTTSPAPTPAEPAPAPAPSPEPTPSPEPAPAPIRGSLVSAPVLTRSFSPGEVNNAAGGYWLTVVTGRADCTVRVYDIEYNTVGARGEATTATAAVMVPSGNEFCSGPRPVTLYAHGTSSDQDKNMSNVAGDTESAAMMAMFAGQGFILVAPNYTGYDRSTLPYHPYLIAEAQADDMVDGLRAALQVLPEAGASWSQQLFVAGYSQGGYVAMATHRAIDQRYSSEFQVLASAPMSGPYALTAFEQTIANVQQNFGAALYMPLLVDGFQAAYGDIYQQASDIYAPPFDTTVPGLLPAREPGAKDKLPSGDDGSYRTLFDRGDGSPYLLTAPFTAALKAGTGTFYEALRRNDLPGDWVPRGRVAMCYGERDPLVFGLNTVEAERAFAARGVAVTVWNLENNDSVPTDVANQFRILKETVRLSAGAGRRGDEAVLRAYHAGLLAPFCTQLSRDMFRDILNGRG